MVSIGAIATAHKGRTTGFDYLRLGLSLAVLAVHCIGFLNAYWAQWTKFFSSATSILLPAFFALSGFLVTASLFRNTIPEFITLRIIRLVPALAFEITLSALILGSYFTVMPLSEYYKSPKLAQYFLNIVGDIHFYLPGVFSGALVNVQLWTIPYELECYAMLVVVALATLLPIKKFFPLALLGATTVLTVWMCLHHAFGPVLKGEELPHLSGRSLVCAFLWACVLYLFRARVWYSLPLAIGAIVIAALALLSVNHVRYEAAATLPIAYVTVYIGLMALPQIKFGDLSYGIYLFHFPIMQTLRLGLHIANTWTLLVATLFLSGLCAFVSWNLIEHPILVRKQAVLAWVNRTLQIPLKVFSRSPLAAVVPTINKL